MQYLDLFSRLAGSNQQASRLMLLMLAGLVAAANFLLIAFPPWASRQEGLALKCALFGNVLCAMLIALVVMLRRAKPTARAKAGAARDAYASRDYGKDWAAHLPE